VHGIVNTLDQVMARRKTIFRMRGPLAAVRVPTLVATGKFDFVCHKPERLFLATIPGAVGARVPGAGHMAPVEQPEEFAKIVGRFLFDAGQRIDRKVHIGAKGSTRTSPPGSASRM
jgi:pimeloyl-ACP methyl ester carboxylesterase